jgi:hypothetical protein
MMMKFSADAAYQFARRGKEFADAAKILNQHCQNQRSHPSWPTYSTACHALELYLKAFLRVNGMSSDYLKDKIRHNLWRAFCEAKQKGLGKVVNFSEDEEHMIKILAPHYRNRDFQYNNSEEYILAHISSLIPLLDRIYPPLLGLCVRRPD